MNASELTQAMAQDAIKKYGSANKAAAALGVGRNTILGRARGTKPSMRKQSTSTATPASNQPADVIKGKSLAEFRQTYDKDTIIPTKIKRALKDMGASWEYERDFVRRAGVSYNDLGTYREMFADYVVSIRRESKRVWAGTPSFAAQLREMV